MQVKRAVITAASPVQHTLPLQRLVDRNGDSKSVLQLIIEEVVGAGVEEIAVVIRPQDDESFREAAGEDLNRLIFVHQPEPLGYGHALYQAREVVAGQAFLHLVGDHLYLSASERMCARQLVDVATAQKCSVSGVQATRENRLPYFGTIGGQRVPKHSLLYQVTRVIEKPTPTQAEQDLIIAGMRAGYYLCFFGMHVLTPAIMEILGDLVTSCGEAAHLSAALSQLADRERYLALEVDGTRYNLGVKYGLLLAQLALGLSGQDREQLLTELVELLATGAGPS